MRGASSERRDLAIATLALGFVVLQLAQCSTTVSSTRSAPLAPTASMRAEREENEDEEREHSQGRVKDEAQEEERAKIRAVARALKTIAADPEMQKTYGFKP